MGWAGGWVTLCLHQLCCLHADMLGSLGPKEAKKAFIDFYHSFLDKTAVRDSLEGPQPLLPFTLNSHLPPPNLRPTEGSVTLPPLLPPQSIFPTRYLGCHPLRPVTAP